MKIKQFRIQGFRSYGEEAQEFDFDERLVVLTAPNSQGKSSTIEALEFLLTGVLERREQFAAAKAEFKNSIRNAHVSDGTETYVEAEIGTDEGGTHKIKRVLVSDYGAKKECQTRLYIDDEEVDDLSTLNIQFESSPLHLPILMQHTLRHTVSGPPKERADFLKSLLDVTDLDTVHTEIRKAHGQMTDVRYETLDVVSELTELTSPFETLLDRLAALTDPSEAKVRDAIMPALKTGISDLAVQNEIEVEAEYAPRRDQLQKLIKSRQDAVYPLNDLQPGGIADESDLDFAEDKSKKYNQAVAKIDRQLKTYRAVYEALIKVDEIDESRAPLDCPVCETEEALTAERIAAIRKQLEQSGDFQKARTLLLREIGSLEDCVDEISSATSSAIPTAGGWDEEEQTQHRKAALSLVEDLKKEEYGEVADQLAILNETKDQVDNKLSAVTKSVNALQKKVQGSNEIDVEVLLQRLTEANKARERLEKSLKHYEETVEPIRKQLEPAVRDAAGLSPFEIVATAAEAPSDLAEELDDQRAREEVADAVDQALAEISDARGEVLDAKFEQLSTDVGKWWNHIRPADRTSFNKVARRGTGLRFVDFKARLTESLGDEGGEVRNAAAVFSDSQLNALGVSTFLAKWTQDSVGFLVLDDPVLASDRAHISTFSRNVIEELLESTELQVLIATYSDEFSQRLEDLYLHRSPSVYFLSISDPKAGTQAKAVSDSLDSRLRRADAYLGNQDPHMRRECATILRRATERFCKELIVKGRRNNGESCSIADYRGESLSTLEPEALQYFTKPDHPGKLKAIRKALNPGPHDDMPPTVTSLKTSKGDLEYFKRFYL